MRLRRCLFLAALTHSAYAADVDGDGYDDSVDCDDFDLRIHPGADEIPLDGIDNDCDGLEGCVVDADGDGHGVPLLVASADFSCGGVTSLDDCDDADAAINPDAVDVCGDGIDNDCDGVADQGQQANYIDADLDGFGDDDTPPIMACPGAPLPPLSGTYVFVGGDCDDANALVNPARVELCDGLDNDCDNAVDNGIPFATHYVDRDLDGFGDPDPRFTVTVQCPPEGYSPFGTDCDDADADVHPLVTVDARTYAPLAHAPLESSEADRDVAFVGDGIDQDCDGVDLCHVDFDGDGYGPTTAPGQEPAYVVDNDLNCANLSAPTSSNDLDCDDGNATVNPSAGEVPGNDVDDNCDGREACYQDADGDGFGSPAVVLSATLTCGLPGLSNRNDDCDDRPGDGAVNNPSASEICDGLDNNCDGRIDEGTSSAAQLFYLDNDGDGWGDLQQAIRACPTPLGYSGVYGDCDDADDAVNPDAREVCANGVDDDCDGITDDCGDTADTGFVAPLPEGGGCQGGWGASYALLLLAPLGRRRRLRVV